MKTTRRAETKRPRRALGLPRKRDAGEWQAAVWAAPDDLLSRPQKLQFMLMLGAAFNNFNPFAVVRDLLKHRDLWHGALMGGGYPSLESTRSDLCRLSADLVPLRDLGAGTWNVDTLFVLTGANHEADWQPVVKGWSADEVRFLDDVESGQLLGGLGPLGELRVMTVWWD